MVFEHKRVSQSAQTCQYHIQRIATKKEFIMKLTRACTNIYCKIEKNKMKKSTCIEVVHLFIKQIRQTPVINAL